MKRRVILVTVVLSVAGALFLLESSANRVQPITLNPGESTLNDVLELWDAGEKDAALTALRETGVDRVFASSTSRCLYLQDSDMRWIHQFRYQDDIAEGIAIGGKLVEMSREIRRRVALDGEIAEGEIAEGAIAEEDHPDVALIYEMAAELQKPTRLTMFQQVGRGLPYKQP